MSMLLTENNYMYFFFNFVIPPTDKRNDSIGELHVSGENVYLIVDYVPHQTA